MKIFFELFYFLIAYNFDFKHCNANSTKYKKITDSNKIPNIEEFDRLTRKISIKC
jgi:hypothetical protein